MSYVNAVRGASELGGLPGDFVKKSWSLSQVEWSRRDGGERGVPTVGGHSGRWFSVGTGLMSQSVRGSGLFSLFLVKGMWGAHAPRF